VYVDELNQVWTNLISNAQQALNGKGRIVIETALAEAEAGAEGAGAAGPQAVAVRIIDDGPGVAPELVPRLFEPFFTTKPKGEGTGLGLGIARRIVHKHGGEIRFISQPGRTVFEVRLPISAISAISAPDAGQPGQPAQAGEAGQPGGGSA
jgi:signal transduction histidine kinase